jgi:hypothetical protein
MGCFGVVVKPVNNEIQSLPTKAKHDEPIWFPQGSDRLAESELDELVRRSFGITIRWYLSFYKRSRVRATNRPAREFIEIVITEKAPGEAELERWREGIRWFFREGRAVMRGEGDMGRCPSPVKMRGASSAMSHASGYGTPRTASVSQDVEHPSPRPSPLGRGEGVDAAAGWRAAMIRKLRVGNYSYQTERSYLNWACRFARRQGERSVLVCGDAEIGAFLDELAVKGEVSAGTQRQALNALVFLFREALRKELGDFSDYLRAKAKSRLPVVLSRGETQGLLAAMEGKHALMARVMYGSGLRLTESMRWRVGVRRLMLGFGGAGGNRCSPFSNSVI